MLTFPAFPKAVPMRWDVDEIIEIPLFANSLLAVPERNAEGGLMDVKISR